MGKSAREKTKSKKKDKSKEKDAKDVQAKDVATKSRKKHKSAKEDKHPKPLDGLDLIPLDNPKKHSKKDKKAHKHESDAPPAVPKPDEYIASMLSGKRTSDPIPRPDEYVASMLSGRKNSEVPKPDVMEVDSPIRSMKDKSSRRSEPVDEPVKKKSKKSKKSSTEEKSEVAASFVEKPSNSKTSETAATQVPAKTVELDATRRRPFQPRPFVNRSEPKSHTSQAQALAKEGEHETTKRKPFQPRPFINRSDAAPLSPQVSEKKAEPEMTKRKPFQPRPFINRSDPKSLAPEVSDKKVEAETTKRKPFQPRPFVNRTDSKAIPQVSEKKVESEANKRKPFQPRPVINRTDSKSPLSKFPNSKSPKPGSFESNGTAIQKYDDCEEQPFDIDEIMNRIGYKFKNPHFLKVAFTQKSYCSGPRSGMEYNQRIEFLGDSVLGLIVSEYIYHHWPNLQEGPLSMIEANLVNATACIKYIEDLGVGEYLLIGRGQELTKRNESMVADLFEAILGAIFLDSDFEMAKAWFLGRFEHYIIAQNPEDVGHSKTALQKWGTQNYKTAPKYDLVQVEGPIHAQVFLVKVSIGKYVIGYGQGSSKKAAEMEAAKMALEKVKQNSRIESWPALKIPSL